MCIHILLIIFTSMQCIVNLESATNFARSQERVFMKYFFDESLDFSELDRPQRKNFYALDELRQFV
jgi:hypothetical protein